MKTPIAILLSSLLLCDSTQFLYGQLSFPAPQTVLAAGRKHTLVLKYDGTVLAGGSGGDGQIGDGTTHLRTNLVSVSGVSNVVGIAAGQLFSFAWMSDGTAWTLAWGDDRIAEMGNSYTEHQQTSAVQITNLTSVIGMSGGNHHGLAVNTNGNVWAWGLNSFGQLGDGTVNNRLVPVRVTNLTGVVAIAAGSWHNLALKTNGTVWGWGQASSGQLGDGTSPTLRTIPVQAAGLINVSAIAAGYSSSLALSNGTVWMWGGNLKTHTLSRTPVKISGLNNIVAIAAGFFHNLALKSDGTVWAWGYNGHGQLGNGTTVDSPVTPVQVTGLSNVVAIAAGGQHSVALKSDGTLATWGYSNYGQEVSFNTTPIKPENINITPPFPTSSIWAYYNFDNNTDDQTGNGINLENDQIVSDVTCNGAPPVVTDPIGYEAGKFNNAIISDGISQLLYPLVITDCNSGAYIYPPGYIYSFLDATRDWSFSCWLKTPSGPDGTYKFLDIGGNNDFFGISCNVVIFQGIPTLLITYFNQIPSMNPNPPYRQYITANLPASSATQFFHVCLVQTGGTIIVYINGKTATSQTQYIFMPSWIVNFSFNVAGQADNGFQYTAPIDELGFWSKALIQSDINALYNNGNGIPYSP